MKDEDPIPPTLRLGITRARAQLPSVTAGCPIEYALPSDLLQRSL